MYFANTLNRMNKLMRVASAATVLLLISMSVQAQVSFDISNETTQAGQVVTVTWTYTGDGSASAIEGRFDFAPTNIDNVDYTNCTSSWTGSNYFSQCLDQGGTNDNVFFQILDTGGNPIPSGTGTIDFTIAAGAPAPSTIDLIWDDTAFVVQGNPTVNATDGSISITTGPQSELSVSPDPIDFGTQDSSAQPQTQTMTITNVGDAGPATVSSVSLATGTDYSLANDGCTGTALAASGGSCNVDVVFSTTADGTYTDTFNVASDADINANPSVSVTGTITSAPNLSITPAFGPVDLGSVVIGSSTSVGGSVTNSGSADGNFSCTYSGAPEITVTPDLSGGVTVPANGGSASFTVGCAVPDTAADGTVYSGSLSCSGDLTGTHEFSCTATAFEPLAVPVNSKWGLAILSLLVLMIGGLTVRFYRA